MSPSRSGQAPRNVVQESCPVPASCGTSQLGVAPRGWNAIRGHAAHGAGLHQGPVLDDQGRGEQRRMRLLLDTHAFLWWLIDDRQLSQAARQAIADDGNDVLVSAAIGVGDCDQAPGRLPAAEALAGNIAGRLLSNPSKSCPSAWTTPPGGRAPRPTQRSLRPDADRAGNVTRSGSGFERIDLRTVRRRSSSSGRVPPASVYRAVALAGNLRLLPTVAVLFARRTPFLAGSPAIHQPVLH